MVAVLLADAMGASGTHAVALTTIHKWRLLHEILGLEALVREAVAVLCPMLRKLIGIVHVGAVGLVVVVLNEGAATETIGGGIGVHFGVEAVALVLEFVGPTGLEGANKLFLIGSFQ